MAVLLPLVVAFALTVSGAAGGMAGDAAVPDGSTVETGPSIQLSVVNWHRSASTLDPAHPAWGRLALVGGPQTVTLTVKTNGGRFFGYAAAVTAPDAPGGSEVFRCSDENHVIESAVVCQFEIPLAAGRNRLDVLFQALNDDTPVVAHGAVLAGELAANAGLEVLRLDGTWQPVGNGGRVALPATLTSALRYTVFNIGRMPFRVTDSCSKGAVHIDGVLVCSLRGPRPGIALGGTYHVPVRLEDATGGTAVFTIDVHVDIEGAYSG